MIGPILRAPRRGPRSSPLKYGLRRRAKNFLVDAIEALIRRLGRWERERLVTERVAITVRGLPAAFDGYRIALLTDLHASPIVPAWWIEAAVKEAVALNADLIALGGDFVDDDVRYAHGLAGLLRPLRAPDGVLAVLGNHDHYVGAEAVRAELRAAGVRELYNEHTIIARADAALAIGGVGDLECDVIDFDRVFAGVPGSVPRLVLSHDPDVFAYWPEHVRLDLMLAGHTHGGQAFLPIIGPPYMPSQFGFRYLGGRYEERGRQLYVSRGIGASGAPIRWKCPPELTELTLRCDITTS